jgi:hypothetical protein
VDLAGDFAGAPYFSGGLSGELAREPYFAGDLVAKHLY